MQQVSRLPPLRARTDSKCSRIPTAFHLVPLPMSPITVHNSNKWAFDHEDLESLVRERLAVHVRSRLWFAAAPETSSSWIEPLNAPRRSRLIFATGRRFVPRRQLVMGTAGINEKAGGATDRNDPEGRLRLLDKNAEIYRDIVPRIVHAAPGAVILVVTDPPIPSLTLPASAQGMIVY